MILLVTWNRIKAAFIMKEVRDEMINNPVKNLSWLMRRDMRLEKLVKFL